MKLHIVRPPAHEIATTGEEPTWDGELRDGATYAGDLTVGLSWHASCADTKNFRKYIEEWISEHRPKTAKQDIAKWRKVSDRNVTGTVPSLARIHLRNFPLSQEHRDRIWPWVKGLLDGLAKEPSSTAAIDSPVVSVQERMKQQVSPILSDIDAAADTAFDGEEVDVEALRTAIFGAGFKAPHLKMVVQHFDKYLNEWNEAYVARFQSRKKELSDEVQQLAEGYEYLPKKVFKDAIRIFEEVRSSIKGHVSSTKVNRIRKRKPQDKKKIVSRLKYKTKDTDLCVESIDPVDIIGASVLWIYDTKKRKLGRYEAEFKDSIFVKGTTIMGIKESTQKVLRKPEEQLKEFFGLKKSQTGKWFEGIRAKNLRLKGRTNSEMLLLKVE